MELPEFTGSMTPQEAVNVCLIAANLTPLVSSASIEENVAAFSAWNLILEESRQVQSEGWAFNTNFNFQLDLNLTGGIDLPEGYLKAVFAGGQYVARGSRLYDRLRNTYSFTQGVTASSLTVLLPWSELLVQARYYIAVRAARRFMIPRLGAEVAKMFAANVETQARVVLEQADNEIGEPNAAVHSPHVYSWKTPRR